MKPDPQLFSRRSALKAVAAGTAAVMSTDLFKQVAAAEKATPQSWKGRINHSVCRWCYPSIPLESLCEAATEIGITGIDLVGPEEWPVLKQYGLHAALPHGAGKGI